VSENNTSKKVSAAYLKKQITQIIMFFVPPAASTQSLKKNIEKTP
jgi:hypothetical protein